MAAPLKWPVPGARSSHDQRKVLLVTMAGFLASSLAGGSPLIFKAESNTLRNKLFSIMHPLQQTTPCCPVFTKTQLRTVPGSVIRITEVAFDSDLGVRPVSSYSFCSRTSS